MMLRPSRFSAIAARFVVELERVDMAELAEHREIVPGAAADLEDSRHRPAASTSRRISAARTSRRARYHQWRSSSSAIC